MTHGLTYAVNRSILLTDLPVLERPAAARAAGPMAALEAAGYSGPVGLEYKATGDDPFAWLPRDRRAAGR